VTAFDELVARVATLEAHTITVEDLPMKPLQRKLEQSWQPDASLLLQPGSVTETVTGLRIVASEVNAAGGTARFYTTTDFSSVRNGVGDYTISGLDFRSAPFVIPAIIASPLGGIVLQASPTAASFSVNTFNTNTGALIDAAWHFIAIAPHRG
jgi:hypothetical protein